jgi:hypothetical protein
MAYPYFVCVLLCCVPIVIGYLLSLADTDPAPTSFPPLRDLPLDIRKLQNVELFFENDTSFKGPESFVMNEDGSFFTGLADGRVVHVTLGEVPKYALVAQTGSYSAECGSLGAESTCGRPLGMRRDPQHPDSIIVADAYKGLMRVNTRSGLVENLVDPVANGLTLVNDLDVDKKYVGLW